MTPRMQLSYAKKLLEAAEQALKDGKLKDAIELFMDAKSLIEKSKQ